MQKLLTLIPYNDIILMVFLQKKGVLRPLQKKRFNMKNSYQKILTPIYVFNIVFQAILSLVSPIAIMLLLAWLLVTKLSVGTWIYVVLIMLGVFSGLYSMVVFVIRACRALEAIEKQNKDKRRKKALNGSE